MQIIDQAVPGPCSGPQVSVARTFLLGPWKLTVHFQCALDNEDSEHTGNWCCSVYFQCALDNEDSEHTGNWHCSVYFQCALEKPLLFTSNAIVLSHL